MLCFDLKRKLASPATLVSRGENLRKLQTHTARPIDRRRTRKVYLWAFLVFSVAGKHVQQSYIPVEIDPPAEREGGFSRESAERKLITLEISATHNSLDHAAPIGEGTRLNSFSG